MFSIEKCQVPTHTLLEKYVTNGDYADCYCTRMARRVSFADFIFAFYTTPLFRLERYILNLAISKPSTNLEARQLADGTREYFAAWRVEDRNQNEILMCDIYGRTRSWLMTIPMSRTNGLQTQLYFGSAVVPRRNPRTGKSALELQFRALLGFHKLYSILLLYSAKSNIKN